MYLTYLEYQNYGGTLPETAFNTCEMQAETLIDWYTFNRLQKDTEFSEQVKKCMYLLVHEIEIQSNLLNGNGDSSAGTGGAGVSIASTSNDGVSTSYNVLSAEQVLESSKSQIESIIKMGLQGVVNSLGRRVLYRGLYADE